ncbi:MAG: YraN family protein [Methylophilaceae bacterium]|jgi:putative endonuclease
MMKINKNNTGVATGKLAVTFKTLKGLKLVAQDYHCRSGGADLIIKGGNTLVFVELRLKSNNTSDSTTISMAKQKQQKLIATARSPFCKPIKTAPVVLMQY